AELVEPVQERSGAAGHERIEPGGEAFAGGGGHAAHGLVAEDRLEQLLAHDGGGGACADLEAGGDEGGGGEHHHHQRHTHGVHAEGEQARLGAAVGALGAHQVQHVPLPGADRGGDLVGVAVG